MGLACPTDITKTLASLASFDKSRGKRPLLAVQTLAHLAHFQKNAPILCHFIEPRWGTLVFPSLSTGSSKTRNPWQCYCGCKLSVNSVVRRFVVISVAGNRGGYLTSEQELPNHRAKKVGRPWRPFRNPAENGHFWRGRPWRSLAVLKKSAVNKCFKRPLPGAKERLYCPGTTRSRGWLFSNARGRAKSAAPKGKGGRNLF